MIWDKTGAVTFISGSIGFNSGTGSSPVWVQLDQYGKSIALVPVSEDRQFML